VFRKVITVPSLITITTRSINTLTTASSHKLILQKSQTKNSTQNQHTPPRSAVLSRAEGETSTTDCGNLQTWWCWERSTASNTTTHQKT